MERTEITKIRNKGITGCTLKVIAIVTMLIDHIGAIVLERLLIHHGLMEAIDPQSFSTFMENYGELYYTYFILRNIGRIAFPIFCFLLVQGFLHTHNLQKYLGRIFIFALISEIPFDLGFSGKVLEFQHQNIFFTLLLGILAIAGIKAAENKEQWNKILRVLLALVIVVVASLGASYLNTDYGAGGVLAITVIYLFRQKKTVSVGVGCAVLMEIPAFLSLIPVFLYNGQRGRNIKWIFYLFYPVHILLLYLISCALGLGQILSV